jgi:hypothetical protein
MASSYPVDFFTFSSRSISDSQNLMACIVSSIATSSWPTSHAVLLFWSTIGMQGESCNPRVLDRDE